MEFPVDFQAKLRENVIEQFKQEKEEDDVEKDDLKRKIEQLSKKVVEFEKREIDRISSDSLATGKCRRSQSRINFSARPTHSSQVVKYLPS